MNQYSVFFTLYFVLELRSTINIDADADAVDDDADAEADAETCSLDSDWQSSYRWTTPVTGRNLGGRQLRAPERVEP